MRSSHLTGKLGEQLALKFLLSRGYSLVQKNYCIRGGEIDLILKKNGIIIFVEVKTRRSHDFGPAEEAFNRNKKSKILRTIQNFLTKAPQINWQLDLITIEFQSLNKAQIRHYQNILID